jgi:hypothetical protein
MRVLGLETKTYGLKDSRSAYKYLSCPFLCAVFCALYWLLTGCITQTYLLRTPDTIHFCAGFAPNTLLKDTMLSKPVKFIHVKPDLPEHIKQAIIALAKTANG